jgi:hypothetical protein
MGSDLWLNLFQLELDVCGWENQVWVSKAARRIAMYDFTIDENEHHDTRSRGIKK